MDDIGQESFTKRMLRRGRTPKKKDTKENLLDVIVKQNEFDDFNDSDNDSVEMSLSEALDAEMDALDTESALSEDEKNIYNEIKPIPSDIKHHDEIDSRTMILKPKKIVPPKKPVRTNLKPNLESTRTTDRSENENISRHIECTISTIPNVNSPQTEKENSPLGIDMFLEDAIGDYENYPDSTYGFSDTRDNNNSQFTTSDLNMPTRTASFYHQFKGKFFHKRRRATISERDRTFTISSHNSSTLNRTTKLYRSLSQRIKKSIKGVFVRDESFVVTSPEILNETIENSAWCEKMEQILQKIKIEQTKITQATKALNVCRSSEEFIGSSEEIETERVLLFATIRKRLLTEELRRISNDSQENLLNFVENKSNKDFVEVSIANIRLPLKEFMKKESNITEWFVVVISEGLNMWTSTTVSCNIDSLFVEFPGFSCTMKNVKPNLKITLEVYSLKLKARKNSNLEEAYHIGQTKLNKSISCPGAGKLLKKVERNIPKNISLFSSSFTQCGFIQFHVNDLIMVSPWPLTSVPKDSILLGTIDLNLAPKFHLDISHQGFLTHCSEAGGIPIRNIRWCVLKGQELKLWKYREDQEEKEPLMTIDLSDCVSERIDVATGSLCSKPRTILIETMRAKEITDKDSMLVECRGAYTIVRHLLSCQTKGDFNKWIEVLNSVVSALREWKVPMDESFPKRSDVISEL